MGKVAVVVLVLACCLLLAHGRPHPHHSKHHKSSLKHFNHSSPIRGHEEERWCKSYTPPYRCLTPDVTGIPAIERARGWTRGATLLERWFSLPANNNPFTGPPDLTTITLEWLLTNDLPRAVFDDMVNKRIWVNSPAKKELVKQLTHSHPQFHNKQRIGKRIRFGDLTRPANILEPEHVNQRAVTVPYGGVFTGASDYMAALANCNLRVAVEGTAKRTKTGWRIHVTQAGIFMRDSFDFLGDQELGCWHSGQNDFGKTSLTGDCVNNASFRSWRTTNNLGGDFLVFSDVRLIAEDTKWDVGHGPPPRA